MPGEGRYVIEKLKLEGWEAIVQVRGKGNLDNNQYSTGVDHYAGDNRFKLIYRYNEEEVVSDEFDFYSDLDPITHYPEATVYDMISISRPADYVIKNYDGVVLMKGVGQDINLEALPFGELTLIIENREVQKWMQPMVEPLQEGLIVFIVKKINGIYHFLTQAKLECGNFDIIEMAPTVQCLTGSYENSTDLPFLEEVLNARPDQIRFSTLQSEEGGRFFKEQNRNMIIEVYDSFSVEVPENYIWGPSIHYPF